MMSRKICNSMEKHAKCASYAKLALRCSVCAFSTLFHYVCSYFTEHFTDILVYCILLYFSVFLIMSSNPYDREGPRPRTSQVYDYCYLGGQRVVSFPCMAVGGFIALVTRRSPLQSQTTLMRFLVGSAGGYLVGTAIVAKRCRTEVENNLNFNKALLKSMHHHRDE